LWRVAVAAARRNKGTWSSLGLGLSLGDILGDILAKYGASLRERVVQCSCCSCVWYLFCEYGDSLSCVLPLEKERSTCLELLLQLATRVYLLVLE
jgi:hypothetical protein